MRKLIMFLLIAAMAVISACSQDQPEKKDDLVLVKGGTFKNNQSNYADKKKPYRTFTSANMRSPKKSGWK